MELGGALPTNTWGGQLSGGRLHGFGFLAEAIRQLRGEAGPRQVKDAEVAVVANGGGPPSVSESTLAPVPAAVVTPSSTSLPSTTVATTVATTIATTPVPPPTVPAAPAMAASITVPSNTTFTTIDNDDDYDDDDHDDDSGRGRGRGGDDDGGDDDGDDHGGRGDDD